jgi:hypothetical protein
MREPISDAQFLGWTLLIAAGFFCAGYSICADYFRFRRLGQAFEKGYQLGKQHGYEQGERAARWDAANRIHAELDARAATGFHRLAQQITAGADGQAQGDPQNDGAAVPGAGLADSPKTRH